MSLSLEASGAPFLGSLRCTRWLLLPSFFLEGLTGRVVGPQSPVSFGICERENGLIAGTCSDRERGEETVPFRWLLRALCSVMRPGSRIADGSKGGVLPLSPAACGGTGHFLAPLKTL